MSQVPGLIVPSEDDGTQIYLVRHRFVAMTKSRYRTVT